MRRYLLPTLPCAVCAKEGYALENVLTTKFNTLMFASVLFAFFTHGPILLFNLNEFAVYKLIKGIGFNLFAIYRNRLNTLDVITVSAFLPIS
jgi:hypothetical protein